MNNSRPATSFMVAGTDITLLNRSDEPAIWVKTRRTMSMPLWQHQISMLSRVKPDAVSYRDELQQFLFQTPGAISLAWYLEQRSQLPLADPVPIALGLLDMLDQWHRRGVAVLTVTPRHLLYRPESNKFWLADWSLALPYSDSTFDAPKNYFSDEITYYASPEQTGKTDLTVDYRSDYFTLGVLLYRIATGRLAFDDLDNASIVYRILTYEPEPAASLNPNLSISFSAILAKLMAKNPADRYQSVDGLRHDLNRLGQADFDSTTFRPGEVDSQGEFMARPLLIGRESTLETVGGLIKNVNEQKQKGIALLTGMPGSGKTALLRELEKTLFATHYILFSDLQNDQTQPYSTLKQAVDGLVDDLIGQSLAVQEDFKFHLDAQIGNVLSVLIDFSPGVQKLVGTTPSVQASLTTSANQDRLAYIIAGFLRALVLTGRPVVWLIDNLHGASDATLRLFNSLAREALLTQFTLVCTDSQEDANQPTSNQRVHAFMQGLESLGDYATTRLTLPDLAEADLANWLLALHIDPDSVTSLAATIHQKTGGNPFSVQRIVQQLTEQRAVSKATGAFFFNSIRKFCLPIRQQITCWSILPGKLTSSPAMPGICSTWPPAFGRPLRSANFPFWLIARQTLSGTTWPRCYRPVSLYPGLTPTLRSRPISFPIRSW